MKPKFSFIIPCFNCRETIHLSVASILGQRSEIPFEVIVVDNNSTDGSMEGLDPRVTIVSASRQGAASARNAGARVAQGKFLIFVDADVEIPGDWLDGLEKLIAQYPWIEAVGGVVIPEKGKDKLLHGLRKYLLEIKSEGSGSLLSLRNPVLNTSLCAVSRSLFEKVGGFDERMLRLEDTLFTKQALLVAASFAAYMNAGKVFYTPDSLISYFKRSYHQGLWMSQLHQNIPYLQVIKPRSETQEPVFELLSVFNSCCVLLGLLNGKLRTQLTFPNVIRPSRISFYLQLKLEDRTYVFNSYLSLVLLPEAIRIFHAGNLLEEFKGEERELLLRMAAGSKDYSEEEKLLLNQWIKKQLFVLN